MRDYNKYLKSGKRLACFGRVVDDCLNINIIVFSKKEQFSKKKALSLYNDFLNGEHVCDISVTLKLENNSPEWLFHKYLRERFYRKYIINTAIRAILQEEILTKSKTDIIVKSKLKHSKWKH
jgi:hypothetical protein